MYPSSAYIAAYGVIQISNLACVHIMYINNSNKVLKYMQLFVFVHYIIHKSSHGNRTRKKKAFDDINEAKMLTLMLLTQQRNRLLY